MLGTIIAILAFIGVVFVFGIVVYLYNTISTLETKIEKYETSTLENISSGEGADVTKEFLLEKIKEVEELKSKAGVQGEIGEMGPIGLMGYPGVQGEPGPLGPLGPPGRTLIKDINDLFDGRDELNVFSKIQDSIPDDLDNLENVTRSYVEEPDKKKSIANIKQSLENNAKNLFGISKLRKLREETSELCKEVITSYERYVKSFEKLHLMDSETDRKDRMIAATLCKSDLTSFQRKIRSFNENLDIITTKKKDFFLGDRVDE